MSDTAHFISVARFARLVSLSERTCWNLIREGLIPVYRVRRRTLIRPDEGVQAIENLGAPSLAEPEDSR